MSAQYTDGFFGVFFCLFWILKLWRSLVQVHFVKGDFHLCKAVLSWRQNVTQGTLVNVQKSTTQIPYHFRNHSRALLRNQATKTGNSSSLFCFFFFLFSLLSYPDSILSFWLIANKWKSNQIRISQHWLWTKVSTLSNTEFNKVESFTSDDFSCCRTVSPNQRSVVFCTAQSTPQRSQVYH